VESGDGKILIVCFAVAKKSDADAVSSASVAVDDNEAMVGNISRTRNQKDKIHRMVRSILRNWPTFCLAK